MRAPQNCGLDSLDSRKARGDLFSYLKAFPHHPSAFFLNCASHKLFALLVAYCGILDLLCLLSILLSRLQSPDLSLAGLVAIRLS
jgi:hypothetical protein